MATVIDSYSQTNQDSISGALATGGFTTRWAQCFTGDGQKIVDAKWYVQKHTGPTGNAVAKIYAMTGTFGTSGVATGSALATSDNVDVSTIGSLALVTFPFSGANQYVTTNGTKYVVSIEYSGGNASNYLELGYDGSSSTHPGNISYWDGSNWVAIGSAIDFCFYVDGVPAAVDVTVNLTGVAGDPQIGTGTVEIGAAPVEPPVTPGGGTGARTGMRLRPTEDKAVYLKGVSADPQVGQVMVLHEMQRVYEAYSAPIRRAEARRPAKMPPGLRQLFKPVEKPIPPALFVYQVGLPKLKSAVGTGKVNAFYEDIDEETIAMIDLL